jgi:hypothetical protein
MGTAQRPEPNRGNSLFDLVAAQVAERDVLYREFGVYPGATTL